MTTHKAPGKSTREGITMVQLCDMFPDEDSAREWFEARVWPDGRHCPHCGSVNTQAADGGNKMPYRCPDCRNYFSVKTNTVMRNSNLPLRKWAFAIYLHLTSLKGVSSMKLHRDIGVPQKTAWFMLQRIRKAWDNDDDWPFGGPWKSTRPTSAARRRTSTGIRSYGWPWRSRKNRRGRGEGPQDQQGPRQGR